jgi:hypothetical protein
VIRLAKYKVLKTFKDIHTNEVYEPNQEIEMKVTRAKEVEQNLDGSFLSRVEENEDEK